MTSYRSPDGVEVVRRDREGFELTVTMPTDEDEFFGRSALPVRSTSGSQPRATRAFPVARQLARGQTYQ